MVRKFKDLRGLSLKATDNEFGTIKDILFDDRTWRVRYLVVDTGTWLPGQKVLLNPSVFPDTNILSDDSLSVSLTKEQIETAPALASDKPVSRQYESTLHDYYGWTPYWGIAGAVGYPYPDATYNKLATSYPLAHADWAYLEETRKKKFDGNLRSLTEVTGYKIGTSDDKEFGEVSDALIERKDWLIIDLVLHSHKWLPGGKEFVCSPMFVNNIDEGSKTLYLDQKKQALINGPDFNIQTYGAAYRKSLVRYYCENSNINKNRKPNTYTEHRASVV